ncbi:unnamed protein product [Calypogeia fissa]
MMARVSVLRRVVSRQRQFSEVFGVNTYPSAFSSGTLRHLNIFSVFNKEAREKESARLKDELNRGYFDDFRELKKTGGKVAIASQNLVPVLAAGKFPSLTAFTKTGNCVSLPITENDNPSARATVICTAFRASAQNMIESWTKPLSAGLESSTSIELVEVSLVDSWFLSLPPVKRLMLRIMRAPELEGELPIKKRLVYAFGDTYFFRKQLGIPNVLAGYLFLVDKKGRIRWRASGMASPEELSSMFFCIRRLLEED